MENILKQKLHTYMLENHPEMVIHLQEEQALTAYLKDKIDGISQVMQQHISDGKPAYIVEEICLRILMSELGPSRFNYVKMILETEFPRDYERLLLAGVLTYETINILKDCREAFDTNLIVDGEDNRYLRYSIISVVADYFN